MHFPNTQKTIRSFKTNGYALFIASTFMFAAMGLCVKLAVSTEGVPLFQVIFFRSFINALLIFIYARLIGRTLRGKSYGLLILRSVVGFLAFTCFFTAISKISLADATILSYTSPVFVSALSVFFLKDRFSLSLLISIFFALFGAVLVVRPSFDFLNTGGVYGILSGFLAAIVYVSIRKLTKNNHSTTIIFHWASISALISLPLMIMEFVSLSLVGWVYTILIGVFSTVGQIFMTKGFAYLEAQKGSLISLFNIVISALLSYFVLGEIIDAYTITGGLLIFGSSIGVLVLKPFFFHKHPNRNY